jgi:tRNA (guanine37-N1)-methyltransferase
MPTMVKNFSSFDVIGDIAIFRIPKDHSDRAKEFAKLILSTHKGLKTVLQQDSPISGEFRLHELTGLAGENKTKTLHKESGCSFEVDLQTCYFSPRLSFERKRIAQLVCPGESIINMFSGVGCFSIIITKFTKLSKVFSIDINPSAIEFQLKNINFNGVYSRVIPILGDSKRIVETHFPSSVDRVLLPLPEKAFEYLDCAVSALKPRGGWIHYYDFACAKRKEDSIKKTILKVNTKLNKLHLTFDIPFFRVVRSIGPNWFQIILDIHIRSSQDKS